MSFSNMLEILQEKNKNLVVLIRLGVFYIATGKKEERYNTILLLTFCFTCMEKLHTIYKTT